MLITALSLFHMSESALMVTFHRVGSVPLPHPGKGEPSTVGFGTDDVIGLRNGCLSSSRPNEGEMKRLPFAFCFQTGMKAIEARLSATRAGGSVGFSLR